MLVRFRCIALALALSVGLHAQIFVVDASSGPGTNYTDLATAVVSVPDGSTLWIRPGSYQAFTIDGKGLTLLADAGTAVAGTCTVRNTSSAQRVLVHGIDFTAATLGTGLVLHAEDCAGLVMLSALTTPPNPPAEPGPASYWYVPRGLLAWQCEQLVLRDCTIAGATLNQCTSVVESCVLRGTDLQVTAGIPVLASIGLVVAGGTADVVGDSQLFPGSSLGAAAQSPALQALTSTVHVRSGTVSSLGPSGSLGWAILSTSGLVIVDPSVAVLAGVSPATFGSVAYESLPEVSSSTGVLGGTLQAAVATANGDLVALLVGAPGPVIRVAAFDTAVWLDPAQMIVQAVGMQQVGAPVTGVVAVPNQSSLRGAVVVWQAVTLGALGLRASSASVAFVR